MLVILTGPSARFRGDIMLSSTLYAEAVACAMTAVTSPQGTLQQLSVSTDAPLRACRLLQSSIAAAFAWPVHVSSLPLLRRRSRSLTGRWHSRQWSTSLMPNDTACTPLSGCKRPGLR